MSQVTTTAASEQSKGAFDVFEVEALKANEAPWVYQRGGQRIAEVAMDSGVAVTVVPRGASNVALNPTTKSNCNHFRLANGAKIPKLGEQISAGTTANGRGLRFKTQVARENRESDSAEVREEVHIPVKMRKRWSEPSAEERVRHSKLHCPFRAWCEFCVMGKCHNDSHTKRNATPDANPVYLSIMLI